VLYYTHTHIRLTALCPGLPGSAGTRMVKPIWILLEQETVSGSGIRWAICKSAPLTRQPRQHPTAHFLQAGCPSCRPTNSVKALKALNANSNHIITRISIQTAELAFSGTGLCSYRVRGVDGSCAKHSTVESYTVVVLLTFILTIISIPSPVTPSFHA